MTGNHDYLFLLLLNSFLVFATVGASYFCDVDPTRAISTPAWPAGTIIEVDCPDGYVFVDGSGNTNSDPSAASITCQSTGDWSENIGSCQPVSLLCDRPVTPNHGRVSAHSHPAADGSPDKFTVGSFISYSCNNGWTMAGDATIFCDQTGDWNAQPPSCVKQAATVYRCYMPAIPSNGDIISQSSTADNFGLTFSPQSRISYICQDGYVMVGQSQIQCNDDGNWNRHPPQCIKVPSTTSSASPTVCNKPGRVFNAKIVRTYPDGQPEKYPLSGHIHYQCDPDYVMRGNKIIECQSDGTWSPAPPICIYQ